MKNLNTNNNIPIGGYALIITGIIFFTGNSIVLDINWGYIWPLILIGIGILLILKNKNNSN